MARIGTWIRPGEIPDHRPDWANQTTIARTLFTLEMGMQHVLHYVVQQTKSFFGLCEHFPCMWWKSLSSKDVNRMKKTREKR